MNLQTALDKIAEAIDRYDPGRRTITMEMDAVIALFNAWKERGELLDKWVALHDKSIREFRESNQSIKAALEGALER